MDVAASIVRELELDHFFNIQLVGDTVIEINPRISTVVYQEDLNLPYLGVKLALGELDEADLARRGRETPPDPSSPALFRPGRMGRVSGRPPRPRPHPLTPHPPFGGTG